MTYTKAEIITTPRLQLVCCDIDMLLALFESDKALAALLGINIPAQWTEFGEPAFRWTYNKIIAGTDERQWLAYLPVWKEENMLVGSCGFKGNPFNGMVEIGYEVAKDYRGKGLATEIATGLIKYAMLNPAIKYVQAHTLAQLNESCKVLGKCGMKKMEELEDPEDGKIWRWEIRK
jgi:[ribosomal protein S5]-alanine N-acetyltransferase